MLKGFLLYLAAQMAAVLAFGQGDSSAPFAFGDFSWLNGNSRKTSPPLIDNAYFTSDITLDLNYTHSYNNPIDNTVVGSTALSRDNELQLSYLGFGGDIHVNHVRGRVMMQFGTRSTVVPPLRSWSGWMPDLVKSENRFVLAALARF